MARTPTPIGGRRPAAGGSTDARSVCHRPPVQESADETTAEHRAEVLTTARLDLHPLTLALIEAVLDGNLLEAQRLAPYPVDATTFAGDEHVLGLRRAQLLADPGEAPWLYRAAVLRTSGRVVGRVGFHAPPDAAGTVEIGYSVSEPQRGRGFATEMTQALLAWGHRRGASRVLASVRPDNAASLAIVAKLGFRRIGEQMDEIDGLEWVFTKELT